MGIKAVYLPWIFTLHDKMASSKDVKAFVKPLNLFEWKIKEDDRNSVMTGRTWRSPNWKALLDTNTMAEGDYIQFKKEGGDVIRVMCQWEWEPNGKKHLDVFCSKSTKSVSAVECNHCIQTLLILLKYHRNWQFEEIDRYTVFYSTESEADIEDIDMQEDEVVDIPESMSDSSQETICASCKRPMSEHQAQCSFSLWADEVDESTPMSPSLLAPLIPVVQVADTQEDAGTQAAAGTLEGTGTQTAAGTLEGAGTQTVADTPEDPGTMETAVSMAGNHVAPEVKGTDIDLSCFQYNPMCRFCGSPLNEHNGQCYPEFWDGKYDPFPSPIQNSTPIRQQNSSDLHEPLKRKPRGFQGQIKKQKFPK